MSQNDRLLCYDNDPLLTVLLMNHQYLHKLLELGIAEERRGRNGRERWGGGGERELKVQEACYAFTNNLQVAVHVHIYFNLVYQKPYNCLTEVFSGM